MTQHEPTISDSHPPAESGHPPIVEFLHPPGWQRGSGFSHGVIASGREVFVAGQIGWDPVTHRIVGERISDQVRQALANIVAILAEAGAEPRHLVRLTWFITDRDLYLREREAIGAAYREVIGRYYPPMSMLVVAGLMEEGADVEIEATAVLPLTEGPITETGADRRQP